MNDKFTQGAISHHGSGTRFMDNLTSTEILIIAPNAAALSRYLMSRDISFSPEKFKEVQVSRGGSPSGGAINKADHCMLEALEMVQEYIQTMKGRGHAFTEAINAAILKAKGGPE